MKIDKEVDIEARLKQVFKGEIRRGVFLRDYTCLKIGGKVEFFLIPDDIEDLSQAVKLFNQADIAFSIIGYGSNLLVDDQDLKIVVFKLTSVKFRQISKDNDIIYSGGGCSLGDLITFSKKHSLSGLEFFWGIPGTVGGAVVMNAGAGNIAGNKDNYSAIGDYVQKIKVMDYAGNISVYSKKDLKFAYRESNLKEVIILGMWLKLIPGDKELIEDNIRKFSAYRKKTQNIKFPNAGCFFKNPKSSALSAGELIDKCDLKGKAIGDAVVSSEHANFIINKGNATFLQMKELMRQVIETVYNKYQIRLEPEVNIWRN